MPKNNKIANAKGLYLEGIRDGNMQQALDKYTGARYTQHSAGVGDGKEGFMEFFGPFLEMNPKRDIRVVRAIEDGRYVFAHVYQSLNDGEVEWVTADLFDTDDDDRIIEHWDVIAPFVGKTISGRTMVDGPTEIEDVEQTDANKKTVQEFVSEVLQGRQTQRVAEFVSTTEYVQHNPDTEDGLDGYAKHSKRLADTGRSMKYHKVHHLIGQGNFVVAYSHVQMGANHYAVFDIFRLKDHLIVEHWDVQEQILAPEEWNNSGKF